MEASYHRHNKSGHCLNHICRDNGASGAELPKITADLSTRCFGYCEPERPGETCLPITGSGAAFIRGSFVGAEKAFGKNSLKF